MALFIIDFDYTVANGHTHNQLMKRLTTTEKTILDRILTLPKEQELSSLEVTILKRVWDIINEIQPINTPSAWLETFKILREAKHTIAFASFGSYGNLVIPYYLREILQIPQDWINEMVINAWLPPKANTADKNEHIAQIISLTDYADVPATVVIVDDSERILLRAFQKGYSIIEAGPYANHLSDMQFVSNLLHQDSIGSFYQSLQAHPDGLAYGHTILPKIAASKVKTHLNKTNAFFFGNPPQNESAVASLTPAFKR